LRYQYLVHHKKEGKRYGLGSKCFSHHTNLSPVVVKDIIDGFHTVDLERDEILVQFFRDRNEWDLRPFMYVDTIPEEYIVQFSLGLPLSMKQKAKVIKLKQAYDEAWKYERTLDSLNSAQRKVYDSLTKDDQREVMDKLINSTAVFDRADVADLPSDAIEGELALFLDVRLPFLKRHKDLIREKRYEQSRSIKDTYFANELTESWERNEPRRRIIDHSLSIQELLTRHLPTLKRVREKESQIPRGLVGDWTAIQDAVRSAQKSKEIDYVSFKVKLMNLCFALHVEMDEYL
jgi:DNA-directed RNA polymerase delta subunit